MLRPFRDAVRPMTTTGTIWPGPWGHPDKGRRLAQPVQGFPVCGLAADERGLDLAQLLASRAASTDTRRIGVWLDLHTARVLAGTMRGVGKEPPAHAVYLIGDRTDGSAYVGVAERAWHRLREHLKGEGLADRRIRARILLGHRLEFRFPGGGLTRKEALDFETELIGSLERPLNVRKQHREWRDLLPEDLDVPPLPRLELMLSWAAAAVRA